MTPTLPSCRTPGLDISSGVRAHRIRISGAHRIAEDMQEDSLHVHAPVLAAVPSMPAMTAMRMTVCVPSSSESSFDIMIRRRTRQACRGSSRSVPSIVRLLDNVSAQLARVDAQLVLRIRAKVLQVRSAAFRSDGRRSARPLCRFFCCKRRNGSGRAVAEERGSVRRFGAVTMPSLRRRTALLVLLAVPRTRLDASTTVRVTVTVTAAATVAVTAVVVKQEKADDVGEEAGGSDRNDELRLCHLCQRVLMS